MAKIITIVRTRNEAKNIGRFCSSYWWADKILVADGGSEDNTVSLAKEFRNVKVRSFDKRVIGSNGLWRNPENSHWNFLIKWAISEGADWILHDDCDCVPTVATQYCGRKLLSEATEANKSIVLAYRIYIYLGKYYFPGLNDPGQSLYGFTPNSGIWFDESKEWSVDLTKPINDANTIAWEKPYSLLHHFAPDEQTIQSKLDFYLRSGQFETLNHPSTYGTMLPLERWMIN